MTPSMSQELSPMSAVRKADSESVAGTPRRKRGVPEGLWMRCEGCGGTVFKKTVEERMGVCPEAGCNYHLYVSAGTRIQQLLDADSFEEWYADLSSLDPLEFSDRVAYPERIK